MNTKDFHSTNNLDFYAGEYNGIDPEMDKYEQFRIGTCTGLWNCTNNNYDILSVINDKPGNGHLQDVFDWFENSCQRDNYNLRLLEVSLPWLREMLIYKYGFVPELGTNNMIKYLRQKWRKPRKYPGVLPSSSFVKNINSFVNK
jgi:hypothetical protein